MADDFFVKEHKKITISTSNCKNSIEIGSRAIDNGFLQHFPGSTLAVYLYLITHIDDNHTIEINPTTILTYLPENSTLQKVKEDLTYLNENDIIDITPTGNNDYAYQIKINTFIFDKKDNMNKNLPFSSSNSLNLTSAYYNKRNIRERILSLSKPSRAELFQAILTYIPPEENILALEKTINQWLEDFDTKMIKELIRRVDKWLDKYNNSIEKAFTYLRSIINDWYLKEINTYQELQYFDNLYRETRELAELYGFPKWHKVKPIHMEIFSRWLKEDFPLSIDVVKLAIQEAFQRKRDGQPSLQYIEENFIKPWKKNKVRNCKQARNLLQRNAFSTGMKTKQRPVEKKLSKFAYQWDNFPWDFVE